MSYAYESSNYEMLAVKNTFAAQNAHILAKEDKPFWEGVKSFFRGVGKFFKGLYAVGHFLPILVTVCWVAGIYSHDLFVLFTPLAILGYASLILTRFWKTIKAYFTVSFRAGAVGLAVPIFPINLCLGMAFFLVTATVMTLVLGFAPAIYTIYFYCNRD